MQKRTKRSQRGIKVELKLNGKEWHCVSSLKASGPDDRHFVLNINEGTITFGDGKHGALPPTGTDHVIVKDYAAVVEQQGRVIADNDWNENTATFGRFYGVYRGIVTNNTDPESLFRLQIQVPTVLRDQAVWAMPCIPVGWTSVPAVGKTLWVAFEGGDPARPVWMGTVG